MPVKCGSFVRPLTALILLLSLTSIAFAGNPGENEESERKEDTVGREQWFMKGRTYMGQPASQMLNRAQQQRETLRRLQYRQAQARTLGTIGSNPAAMWSPLGPAPMNSVAVPGEDGDYGVVTGRTTTVVVDQNDTSGNTVYVGGAYGGLWKSTTAANADITKVLWKPIIDDQATVSVGSMAVQPGNGNVLLVGTGEANSSADSYYGLGILRSEDGGNSWTLINSSDNGSRVFHGLAISKIAFSTDNPNIVVLAASSASEGITVGAEAPNFNATRGIYYSYDSGKTWSRATMSDGASTPADGSVSSVFFNSSEHKFYAAFRAHGFYVSTDGITWTRMGSDALGLTQPPVANLNLTTCTSNPVNLSGCPLYRGEIAQVPGRNEMYVIVVDAADANRGIYQTRDGGKTWASISTAGMSSCGNDTSGCDTTQGDYNLALSAVPDNTSTDLYVGAVNIFRCNIPSGGSTCSFANLTHVYGCNAANVHPDQHSFDFSATNPDFMYFGNDGGIYRTLSSRTTHATSNTCGGGNTTLAFDNLNGTMGSMTQFVWFSQHPTVQTTLLGGTQDNGSPMVDATYSGTNGVLWRSVQGGDGGYNDINPNNPSERFASFPASGTRVLVRRCTVGDLCDDNSSDTSKWFTTVVRSATLGGDTSAFYMPYMLDPQDPTKLIMGTCKVWRSTTSGTGAVALSQNFDSTTGACATGSPSFVTAIAAGGPVTSSGSQVMYAGTDSGKVFFTNSANSATVNWTQISNSGAFSNPSVCGGTGAAATPCPISGVAIDPNVSSGLTAYVTVMGFNTSHVWRTTDGGQTWSNITGNLPDSPADGVVVYKADGTIYVATDVGVYSTTVPNGSNTLWTEVGPATGTGTLPNVAVTRIAIFQPAGAPARLRVSTYGRGVWEIPLAGSSAPDYTMAISDADQVVFAGQTATYHGTITALNGYNSNITISCNSANGSSLPATCTPSAISNGAFTVTVANATAQDFSFRILAVGGDTNTLTRQVPVSMRVVNFTLGTANPSAVTNLAHGSSTTVQVPVTSQGSFSAPVTFDCSGQPVGWTCTAPAVTPQPGATTNATVTINTLATTAAPAAYPFNIVATSSGLTTPKSQAASVAVITKPDFNISGAAFSNSPVKLMQPLQGSFSISAIDGYTGTVNLSCTGQAQSGIPPANCSFSLTPGGPSITSVIPGNDPLIVYLTVATTSPVTASSAQLTVQASDGTITKTANLPFVITDYTLGNVTTPANVAAGNSTSFSFKLTPINGYSGTVALTCNTSALPVTATCTLNPPTPITLAPGTTTTVNATVSVPLNETPGTYSINVNTSDQAFPPLTHNQATGTFQVTPPPDFTLNATVATDTVVRTGTSNMTLQTVGQNAVSAVDYAVSGCPANAACSISPGSWQTIVGTARSSTVTVTPGGSTPVGAYTITVVGTSSTATHSTSFTLNVVDYTIDFGATTSKTVAAGQGTTAAINFTSNTGSATFNSAVTFAVAGCPTLATCTVAPNPFNPSNANPANPTLTVTTTASSTSGIRPSNGTALAFWMSVPFGAFGIVILRRHRAIAGMLVVTCALLLGLSACGGGGGGGSTAPTFHAGTPAGTYTLMVTSTSGTTVKQANFTLTVQ